MTAQGIFEPADLSTCISCGFCLPACPTYKLTGDEASSPRGRIALMRAVEEGEVDVFDVAAREQGSFCLGCRACEPVCPAGVPYGRLIEQLRDAQWTGRRRPWRILPLLAFATSRTVIRAAGLLRRHARNTAVADGETGETGDTLMLGCFERVLFPGVSKAAAATIPGLRVPSDQGCCGALHAHNGDIARGEELARNLGERPGRIVSTAGGCAAHLASGDRPRTRRGLLRSAAGTRCAHRIRDGRRPSCAHRSARLLPPAQRSGRGEAPARGDRGPRRLRGGARARTTAAAPPARTRSCAEPRAARSWRTRSASWRDSI